MLRTLPHATHVDYHRRKSRPYIIYDRCQNASPEKEIPIAFPPMTAWYPYSFLLKRKLKVRKRVLYGRESSRTVQLAQEMLEGIKSQRPKIFIEPKPNITWPTYCFCKSNTYCSEDCMLDMTTKQTKYVLPFKGRWCRCPAKRHRASPRRRRVHCVKCKLCRASLLWFVLPSSSVREPESTQIGTFFIAVTGKQRHTDRRVLLQMFRGW